MLFSNLMKFYEITSLFPIDSTHIEILRTFIDNTVEELSELKMDISFLNYRINEIQEWIEALEKGVLDVSAQALSIYLEKVKTESISKACKVIYGPDYGITNLTDWVILDTNGNLIYSYKGNNWDEDKNIIQFIEDFEYVHDLLTREIKNETSPSYGLYSRLEDTIKAKNIFSSNYEKILNLGEIIDRYIGGPDGDETIAIEEGQIL